MERNLWYLIKNLLRNIKISVLYFFYKYGNTIPLVFTIALMLWTFWSIHNTPQNFLSYPGDVFFLISKKHSVRFWADEDGLVWQQIAQQRKGPVGPTIARNYIPYMDYETQREFLYFDAVWLKNFPNYKPISPCEIHQDTYNPNDLKFEFLDNRFLRLMNSKFYNTLKDHEINIYIYDAILFKEKIIAKIAAGKITHDFAELISYLDNYKDYTIDQKIQKIKDFINDLETDEINLLNNPDDENLRYTISFKGQALDYIKDVYLKHYKVRYLLEELKSLLNVRISWDNGALPPNTFRCYFTGVEYEPIPCQEHPQYFGDVDYNNFKIISKIFFRQHLTKYLRNITVNNTSYSPAWQDFFQKMNKAALYIQKIRKEGI